MKYKKSFLLLITVFTMVMSVTGQQSNTLFNETFGASGTAQLLANHFGECVQAPVTYWDYYYNGSLITAFDNDYYCGYGNPPLTPYAIDIYYWDGVDGGICTTDNCYFQNIDDADIPHFNSFVSFLSSPINITEDAYLKFSCWDNSIGNTTHYIGVGDKDSLGNALWLALEDGGCGWSAGYRPDWLLSNTDCVELDNLTSDQCTSSLDTFTIPMTLVADEKPTFNWDDLGSVDYVGYWTFMREYNGTDQFALDDVILYEPLTESLVQTEYVEDFEDHSMNHTTYTPVTSMPDGSFIGSVENQNYSFGYKTGLNLQGNEQIGIGFSDSIYHNGTKSHHMSFYDPASDSDFEMRSMYFQMFPHPITLNDSFNMQFWLRSDGADPVGVDYAMTVRLYDSLGSPVQVFVISDSASSNQCAYSDNSSTTPKVPLDEQWHWVNITTKNCAIAQSSWNLSRTFQSVGIDAKKYAYSGTSTNLYLDDILLSVKDLSFGGFGNITSQTLPEIIGLSGYPETGNLSTVYQYTGVIYADYDPRVAFDCETDGTLELEWTTNSGTDFNYNCTYGTEGLKTATLYVSNEYYEPTNNSDYAQVNVTTGIGDYYQQTVFEETFGTTSFSYSDDYCQTTCDATTCQQAYGDPMDFGNQSWFCYMNTKSTNYLQFDSTENNINTPKGIDITSTTALNFGYKQRKVSTIYNGGSLLSLDLLPEDYVSFACMIPDQAENIDTYLYVGEWDDPHFLLSLGKDDSQESRCNFTGIPNSTIPCCDLSNLVGEALDCKSDTKVNVLFQITDLNDVCPEYDDLMWQDIEEVGIWITEYDFIGTSHIYLDDIKFQEQYGEIIINETTNETNAIPIIGSMQPSNNPTNVSNPMNWSVWVWDDNSMDYQWTAFDCDNNGVLEYGWTLNRTRKDGHYSFDCTYTSIGEKTAKALVSDTYYYPTYTYDTADVTVFLEETEEDGIRGGSCDGFVAPTCTGDCALYDDFYYDSYPITCNGWTGSDIHPINQTLIIKDMLFSEPYIEKVFTPIYDYEQNTAVLQFNWIANSEYRVIITYGSSLGGYEVGYLYWDSGILYALDYLSPSVTALGTYNLTEEYPLVAEIDFTTKTIEYTVFDTVTTVEFFDGSADRIEDFQIVWDSYLYTDFVLDDVLLLRGEDNLNGTAPVEEIDYEYDSNFFCAINWTAEPYRFSIENCEARGYPTTGNLLGLCMPRACLSDMGAYLFNIATGNILMTIVIVMALILIAPLLVAIANKRR